MDSPTNVWILVAGTVGGAIALIAVLFVGAWLAAHYWQRQVSELETIRVQWAEHYEEYGEEMHCWHRRVAGWSLSVLVAIVVFLVMRVWPLLIALMVLLIPVGYLLGGVSTIKTRYCWDRGLWHPVRLVTGQRAVRRGWIAVAVGVLVLGWLLYQVVAMAITVF